MTVINESGLYRLTSTSRKPEAKRLRKWVTGEVLPSIRKTGPPVVFERDGAVFTNSRDVAACFRKEHRHVLRDIGRLIEQVPGGLPNFGQVPYVDPQNGQTYRSYDMDRDGFMLLAMGFTGQR